MVSRYQSAVHYAALGEGDDVRAGDLLPDGHRAGSSYACGGALCPGGDGGAPGAGRAHHPRGLEVLDTEVPLKESFGLNFGLEPGELGEYEGVLDEIAATQVA